MSTKSGTTESGSGLKKDYLSFVEVIAQAIGGIAPSATPALVIPLVFATAGNGTWLAYLFAMIAVVLIGVNLNQFTKRSASPGSLYEYIVKGLGTNVGVIAGWALVLAYLLTASAVLCGFINYANVLLEYVGIVISPIIIGLVGALVAWFIAVKDIRLSSRVLLVLEGSSLLLISTLAVIVLAKHGFQIDFNQLTLKGVSPENIRIGLVLAFFSFTCFESAVSLGAEAKAPLRTIPKAVTISAIFVGAIFVIVAYTEVLGFIGSTTKLNEAAAPLSDLANFNGVGFFGPLISVGALVSFWASFLACTNFGARILFSLGRHGVFHSSVGNTHESNKTPHIAITIIATLAAGVAFVLIALGNGLFDIYGWVGTIATYGYLLIYTLIVIAAPVYLRREKELKTRHIVISALTFFILLIPIVGSVYPLPALPYGAFPFIFAAWLIAGGLWFFIRKFQSPELKTGIENNIKELDAEFRELRLRGDGEGI